MQNQKTFKLTEILAGEYASEVLKELPGTDENTAFLSASPLTRHFCFAILANQIPLPLKQVLSAPNPENTDAAQTLFGSNVATAQTILDQMEPNPLARDSYIALSDLCREGGVRLELLQDIEEPSEKWLDIIWHLHPQLCTTQVLKNVWQRNIAIKETLIGIWLEENMPDFSWAAYRAIIENGDPLIGSLQKVHDYFLMSMPFPPPPIPATKTIKPVESVDDLMGLCASFDCNWHAFPSLGSIRAGRYYLYEHWGEEPAFITLRRDDVWGWCLHECLGLDCTKVSLPTIDKIVQELDLPPIIFGCRRMGPGAISFVITHMNESERGLEQYISNKARQRIY